MIKYSPSDEILKQYIDYYWIVDDSYELFKDHSFIREYPGVSPELIFILKGKMKYFYQGKMHERTKTTLCTHIDELVQLYPLEMEKFIFVKFKERAMAVLLPFVNRSAKELLTDPIIPADSIFGNEFNAFENYINQINISEIAIELDHWFFSLFNPDRQGFISDVSKNLTGQFTVKNVMELTNTSYSTVERYFKKEVGHSPKKFLILNRFRSAINELYDTQNEDWMNYVVKYDYFDQAHFIKEIKRFSGFTPSQLIATPCLQSYRPNFE